MNKSMRFIGMLVGDLHRQRTVQQRRTALGERSARLLHLPDHLHGQLVRVAPVLLTPHLVPDAIVERGADGDGLLDGVETNTGQYVSATNTGTSPLKRDSDSDGFTDRDEIALGTNPDDAKSYPALPSSWVAAVQADKPSHWLRFEETTTANGVADLGSTTPPFSITFGAGILDGDYVVVRQQRDATNGDIVVAMIDEEATVKRFFREGNGVRLQEHASRFAWAHLRCA